MDLVERLEILELLLQGEKVVLVQKEIKVEREIILLVEQEEMVVIVEQEEEMVALVAVEEENGKMDLIFKEVRLADLLVQR